MIIKKNEFITSKPLYLLNQNLYNEINCFMDFQNRARVYNKPLDGCEH